MTRQATRCAARPDRPWHAPVTEAAAESSKLALVQASLAATVPLLVAEYVAEHPNATEEELRELLASCAQTSTFGATAGDGADGADFLYRSRAPGGTAVAHTQVARSIALALLIAGPVDGRGDRIVMDLFGLRFRLSLDGRGCEVTEPPRPGRRGAPEAGAAP